MVRDMPEEEPNLASEGSSVIKPTYTTELPTGSGLEVQPSQIGPEQFEEAGPSLSDFKATKLARESGTEGGEDLQQTTPPASGTLDRPATGEFEMTDMGAGTRAGQSAREIESGLSDKWTGMEAQAQPKMPGAEAEASDIPAELEGQGVSRWGVFKSGLQRNVSELQDSVRGTVGEGTQGAEDLLSTQVPEELAGQGVSRMGMLKSGFRRNMSELKESFGSSAEDATKSASGAVEDASADIATGEAIEAGAGEEEAVAGETGIGSIIGGVGEAVGAGLTIYGLVQSVQEGDAETQARQQLNQTLQTNIGRANVIPTMSSTYQMSSMPSF
tara:strand:- start:340 stop:1326 length:987 start_codon:yes stop_codon:yes gene_type:complete